MTSGGELIVKGKQALLQLDDLEIGPGGRLVLRPASGGIRPIELKGSLLATGGTLVLEPPASYTLGDSWTIADLGVGFVGSFDSLESPPDTVLDLAVVGNALVLTILPVVDGCDLFSAPATLVTTGAEPFDQQLGDLDGDGQLDLVVVNRADDDVSVRLGDGAGGFGPAFDHPCGDFPFDSALGDVDGDGLDDVVVAARTEQTVHVLLSLGDGTLLTSAVLAATDPAGVALGDLDGDGALDLLAIGRNVDELGVWLGVGDGTFGAATVIPVGDQPRDLVLGDLDGDGALDAITVNVTSDDLSVLLGVGDGTFGPPASVAVGESPRELALGDLDDDGDLDAVVAVNLEPGVTLLLGLGDGTFAAPGLLPAFGAPTSVTLADLDADGLLDVVGASIQDDIGWYLQNLGGGTFGDPRLVSTSTQPIAVRVVEVTGDGKLDLVIACLGSDLIEVYPSVLAWLPLPGGVAGAAGLPQLIGRGCLEPGEPVDVTLSNAAPGAATGFILGLGELNAPFKGGTLVPTPDFLLDVFVTDAQGEAALPLSWPLAAPSGFSLWMQWWVVDPTAPKGMAGSNGLRADAP